MVEVIRQVVRQELSRLVLGDVGVVTAVDWGQQRARVRLSSSEQETSWLAIGAEFASRGDGSLSPLAVGDQVKVSFMEGRPGGQGIVERRVYGANAVPELPEGSFGVKRGAHKVIFGADGKIAAEVAGCSLQSAGTVEIDGTSVKLGGGVSAAVKYEELSAALGPWALAVVAKMDALAALHSLPPTPIPLVLSGARAAKTRVG